MNPGDLVNAAGVVRNNPYFEPYDCPEGVTVQLTPSNDVNEVYRDGVVIAVFKKDNGYDLHNFLRTLRG